MVHLKNCQCYLVKKFSLCKLKEMEAMEREIILEYVICYKIFNQNMSLFVILMWLFLKILFLD